MYFLCLFLNFLLLTGVPLVSLEFQKTQPKLVYTKNKTQNKHSSAQITEEPGKVLSRQIFILLMEGFCTSTVK